MKADIFFVVTTVAVTLVSIGIIIALFYVIRILKDLKVLSAKAKDEGEKIIEDLRMMREGAESKGAMFGSFLSAIFGFGRSVRKARKAKKDEE